MSVQSSGSGSTVLDLVGELDLASAPDMRQSGLAALDDPGCSTLVLDVEKLTFVDSTGIGSWVELRNHAQQNDQRLALRGVSDNSGESSRSPDSHRCSTSVAIRPTEATAEFS